MKYKVKLARKNISVTNLLLLSLNSSNNLAQLKLKFNKPSNYIQLTNPTCSNINTNTQFKITNCFIKQPIYKQQ